MVAGISGSVRRARVLSGGASGEGRVGPRGHARSVHGEAFAGGGLLRRSARVAFTPTVAVVALTIVRGAAPVKTVVAVRAVLLGGAAAVDRGVGPPAWKSKFYGAFVLNRRVDLHAIDAPPARRRGDAGSSPLDGASTPRHRREIHWLISTQDGTRVPIYNFLDALARIGSSFLRHDSSIKIVDRA